MNKVKYFIQGVSLIMVICDITGQKLGEKQGTLYTVFQKSCDKTLLQGVSDIFVINITLQSVSEIIVINNMLFV